MDHNLGLVNCCPPTSSISLEGLLLLLVPSLLGS